jgi:flagellar hook protein FlgE
LNNNSVSQTIKNVATGKDYVTLIDTVNRLNSGNPDFADGSTHPTTSGYIKYANRLSPLLSSSGFVVDGPQSGEILKETENYTLTLARGATFAGDQTITISVRTGTISATASTVINNASSNVQITPANGTTGFTFTYTTLDTSGTIEITFSNDQ